MVLQLIHPGDHPAAPTSCPGDSGLDVDREHLVDHVHHAEDVHSWRAHRQLTHERRV
jgi:hypothetical protein